METLEITTGAVLQHHLEAFGNNDIGEMMKDYAQDAEIWGPDGALVGAEAISAFYTSIFPLLPKGSTTFELKRQLIKQDKAYIAWSADSPFISIPLGTDSFLVKDGKIVWQSFAAQIIPKS